jgi:hypothetical protein
MKPQVIEVATDNGMIKLEVTQLDAPTVAGAEESKGYKEAVLECHKVLDAVGIPPAKGSGICTDPTCVSDLGHRMRVLRDRAFNAETILEILRHPNLYPELPARARELLLTTGRQH